MHRSELLILIVGTLMVFGVVALSWMDHQGRLDQLQEQQATHKFEPWCG